MVSVGGRGRPALRAPWPGGVRARARLPDRRRRGSRRSAPLRSTRSRPPSRPRAGSRSGSSWPASGPMSASRSTPSPWGWSPRATSWDGCTAGESVWTGEGGVLPALTEVLVVIWLVRRPTHFRRDPSNPEGQPVRVLSL